MYNDGDRYLPRARGAADTLARGLGWFSIALGAAEVLAPRSLTRALGMEGGEGLVQAYGAREIATGVAILSSDDPAPGIWGRVAGDVLDLLTLAPALDADNPRRENAAIAVAMVAGVTALDVFCAQALSSRPPPMPLRIMRDYRHRSGFPRPTAAMFGAAADFEVPTDFRTPELLRAYTW